MKKFKNDLDSGKVYSVSLNDNVSSSKDIILYCKNSKYIIKDSSTCKVIKESSNFQDVVNLIKVAESL